MRIFVFLLCTTVFGFSSGELLSQNAKIVIDVDKTLTVDEVFDMIKHQTDYTFIYKSDLFNNLPKVSVKKGTIKANKLLQQTLTEGEFIFELSANNTIIIKEKPEISVVQQLTITGKVSDANGIPLPNVNVLVGAKGSTRVRGVSTDFDGKYSIEASPGEVIKFSYVGFVTQEFTVTNQNMINVVLLEDTSELDEVVLVGYGQQTKKKDLTGSIGSIKAVEVKQEKTLSIDQALVGKISGVYVSSGSGVPGSSNSVIIRGLSSINGDNQPLYVVDGVPIVVRFSTSVTGGLAETSTHENPLLAINPDEVERIDVLKDASAAGIYGSRAANGVVIITTKNAKRNSKPKITFSTSVSVQNPTNQIDYLSGDEYRAIAPIIAQRNLDNSSYPAWQNSFRFPVELQIIASPDTFFGDGNTNWTDELTNKNAIWTKHNISISGGSENTSYYLSTGTEKSEGLILNVDYKAYNFISKLDTQITDKLKVGASMSLNYVIDNQAALNTYGSGQQFRPDYKIFNDDGSYTTYVDSYGVKRNPIGDLENTKERTLRQNILGNIYGEWEIFKNIKFKSQLGISLANTNREKFTPNTSYEALSYQDYGLARLLINTQNNFTSSFNNTISYDADIAKDHHINFVGGLAYERSLNKLLELLYLEFPDNVILTNPASANIVKPARDQTIETGLNSIFGRVNYNYNDRYLATFTVRTDKSTKFGPNNQSGFFPSAALAWNVHNEPFFNKASSVVNQLKLRASLGRTGSDNLAAFTYLSYAASLPGGNSTYDGVNGLALLGFPNSDIRWETTNQLDLGVEFGLFNNRINGEVIYFEKNTSDLILSVPLAPQLGFPNFTKNVADVTNKGWEITLGSDIIRNKNFNWNSSLNVSFIKNNLVSLHGGLPFQTFLGGFAEGQPLGVNYAFNVLGIAQTQAEIDALNTASPTGQYYGTLLKPGDYIYEDTNGDNIVTNEDRQYLGSSNPDYFGGWNNTLSYKNIDFTFNFQFSQGNTKIIQTPYGIANFWDISKNFSTQVYDTWTPDNPDAKLARIGSTSYPINGSNSKGLSDASYTRLRYVAIGYNFNPSFTQKIGLESANITLSGNNLLTFTKFEGLDPESGFVPSSAFSSRFSTYYSYPVAKTISLALNITF